MEYLFDEVRELDAKTLFIIGNGFDKAHHFKTSYEDFREWLISNKCSRMVSLMDIFFSNRNSFWSYIEEALGDYNASSIVDFCKPYQNIDYDHPTRSVAAIEDAPEIVFEPTVIEFMHSFEEWVDSIELLKPDLLKYTFPAISKYLTFNYTETLELYYSIPTENVLHIHGSRLSHGPYIIGHANLRDSDAVYNDDEEFGFVLDTEKKVIDFMNEYVKPSDSIISQNIDFFESLKGFHQIVAYGNSFGKVDWPYMKKIIDITGRDLLWKITYHDRDKDLENINTFISAMKLTNVKLVYV